MLPRAHDHAGLGILITDAVHTRAFTSMRCAMVTGMSINITMSKTMTMTIEKMTNHIIPPGLTLMAGWRIPANDNRSIRVQRTPR